MDIIGNKAGLREAPYDLKDVGCKSRFQHGKVAKRVAVV